MRPYVTQLCFFVLLSRLTYSTDEHVQLKYIDAVIKLLHITSNCIVMRAFERSACEVDKNIIFLN